MYPRIIVFPFLCFLVSALMGQELKEDTLEHYVEESEHLISTPTMPRTFYSPSWIDHGLGEWNLHEGLNAQLSTGIRVGWGRYNPWRGASFFTGMAAMYALPVSKDGKWTVAVGGYYSNFRLWGSQVNTVGVMGMMDYQINERLNVTGFLTHDFGVLGGHRMGAPYLPFLEDPNTTIGANLGIRISPKAALSVGVSFTTSQSPYSPHSRPVVSPHRMMEPGR